MPENFAAVPLPRAKCGGRMEEGLRELKADLHEEEELVVEVVVVDWRGCCPPSR